MLKAVPLKSCAISVEVQGSDLKQIFILILKESEGWQSRINSVINPE